jgi:uncharacterized protein YkwD
MTRISIRREAAALALGVAVLCGATGAANAGAPTAVPAAAHKITPPKLPAVCPDAGLAPTASNLLAVDRATICLVNKERVARGFVALAENARLGRAATRHSQNMVVKGFFSDIGPGGQTVEQRALAAGYARKGSRFRVGENIAIWTVGADTPSQTVAAWMRDPGHRAVILRPFYRETGVGVAAAIPHGYLSGRPGATYTQVFGVVGAS